jgi:hypothetical protein
VDLGPGWNGAEKFATTGIPSTDTSSSTSKAEIKIKILNFNVIVFKSQLNSFWLRAASKCSVQPTFTTRVSISIIRVLTWTILKSFSYFTKICYVRVTKIVD